jgi:hypothetical protein
LTKNGKKDSRDRWWRNVWRGSSRSLHGDRINYVNLNGNSIRDLAAVEKGFLILAGAGGDGISPYQVYFWDGKDIIPGKDKQPTNLKLLGEIPAPSGAKAEGITVIEETNSAYKILVVYDGIANGNPTLFEVSN